MHFDNDLWRTVPIVLASLTAVITIIWTCLYSGHDKNHLLVGILAFISPTSVAFTLWCRLAREGDAASMPGSLGLVALSLGGVISGAVLLVNGWRTTDPLLLVGGGGYLLSVAMWLTGLFHAPRERLA